MKEEEHNWWRFRYVTWMHDRRKWKRRDDNSVRALNRELDGVPMARISRMIIKSGGIRRTVAFFSAYGDNNTPEEVMEIVNRYEVLYELREVPVSTGRFVAMLRIVTGWPIVVGKTGMKRWMTAYVQSEKKPESAEADD